MFKNIQGFTLKSNALYQGQFCYIEPQCSGLEDTENRAHRTETKERNGWLSHLLVAGEMLGGARLQEGKEKQRETKGKQKIDPCSL